MPNFSSLIYVVNNNLSSDKKPFEPINKHSKRIILKQNIH